MDIQKRFAGVHWIWEGAVGFVYEVHPRIVVKVPRSGEEEREQFHNELRIYGIISQHQPWSYVVQCFHSSDNGIFLEYMRDRTLWVRIQHNHFRDPKTRLVTKVEKLEPLVLGKKWIYELAGAVAFLESLNLSHGDLRPDNILLDRNRLKLSDFDCTAEFGTELDATGAPYARIHNSNGAEHGRPGGFGNRGPRTEQFALGSLFYLINYGFPVYDDRGLTEDPREHGPKTLDLMRDMVFPELDGEPLIDDIIDKCWHYRYATVKELAAHTERLLAEEKAKGGTNAEATNESVNGDNCDDMLQDPLTAESGDKARKSL